MSAAVSPTPVVVPSNPTSPIQVKNIDHVTLVVADLERSRKFYCDLLGMQQVTRPGFHFPGMWFQIGVQQIHLIETRADSAPAGFPAPPEYVRPGRTFHYAFEVNDATQVIPILQAHGVEVKGEARHRPDGCLQTFCYDPDGHVVEIFSRPQA